MPNFCKDGIWNWCNVLLEPASFYRKYSTILIRKIKLRYLIFAFKYVHIYIYHSYPNGVHMSAKNPHALDLHLGPLLTA